MTATRDLYGQVAEILPSALVSALNSYRLFMGNAWSKSDSEDKAADHKNYHQAQNVCLSHIEHILKLAGQVREQEKKQEKERHGSGENLAALIARAQEEINGYRKENRNEQSGDQRC